MENQKKTGKLRKTKKTIGILGIHGSREEHARAMQRLGFETIFLREKEDYSEISGIILPGGESSSFGRLLEWTDTRQILTQKIFQENIPVFGTCAGAILLASKGSEYSLGAVDIDIDRNAYGRQIDSFSENLEISEIREESQKFHALFIRAPKIIRVGESVEVLAKHEENPVLIRDSQKKILVSTFHPELTEDTRIHEIFAEMIT